MTEKQLIKEANEKTSFVKKKNQEVLTFYVTEIHTSKWMLYEFDVCYLL